MPHWKTISDYPDFEVSDEGQVRYKGGWQTSSRCEKAWPRQPYLVSFSADKDGYLKVRLSKGGRRIKKTVHRLVAEAFIPRKPGKLQVNHLDGVKTNNHLSNLEWVDSKGNHHHRRHVLLKNIGEACGASKLTEEQVRAIRAAPGSHEQISKLFGVSRPNIGYIMNRKTWTHLV
jgi:HNH endonuclease